MGSVGLDNGWERGYRVRCGGEGAGTDIDTNSEVRVSPSIRGGGKGEVLCVICAGVGDPLWAESPP